MAFSTHRLRPGSILAFMFFSRLLSLDYSRFVCFPHSSSIDVLILAFLPKEMSESSTSKNVIFYPTIALTGRSYCLLLICLTADRSNIFFFFWFALFLLSLRGISYRMRINTQASSQHFEFEKAIISYICSLKSPYSCFSPLILSTKTLLI